MSNIKMGLTIEEAAECTGIGRNTMRKLVDWGKLPVLKVGRKAIIRRDAYCGNRIYEAEFTMSATTKPIKDKIPAQAYLLHTICFLDTGSDTAYFPHFHCSSQVVREIIIDIISIGMSKKLIYIVPLFSNMNINAIIMAISIITRGKPYFFLIVRKSFVNSPFISFPPLHRKA